MSLNAGYEWNNLVLTNQISEVLDRNATQIIAYVDGKVVGNGQEIAYEVGVDSDNYTSIDKIYLLNGHKVYEYALNSTNVSIDMAFIYTRQLDFYKNIGVTSSSNSNPIKKYNALNTLWWFRAACLYNKTGFWYINTSGASNFDNNIASKEYDFVPKFHIV